MKPAYHVKNYYKFVNAATGLDLDQYSLRKIIHRSRNLHRAFNLRRGITRADDKPPEDHWKYRFPEIKEYEECAFCRAVCPSRGRFVEPDSGLPLGCDFCESVENQNEPVCVEWCIRDVLKYEEREEEVEEQLKINEVETGLSAMADKFGWDKILRTAVRLTQKA